MRISTNTIYSSATTQIGDLQSGLAKTQQQLSTGRRMLSGADDPVASAQALEVTQSDNINSQFAINRQNATNALSKQETALSGVTELFQDIKTHIVNAGSGAMTTSDRASLAVSLQSSLDSLLNLANTVDGSGKYIFSGYQTSIQPFNKTATGAQYQGDQGQQLLQVSTSRQIALNDSGDSVFEHNKTGNGIFATSASAANTGSGIVSSGSVTNTAALTNHNYAVTFTVAAGVTTYDVLDTTTGLPVPPAANPYVSSQSIAFDGLQLSVTGAPANGDQFMVAPSTNQSIFTTLTNLIATLGKPSIGATAQAALTNGLSVANDNADKALDNILSVRASIGSRLKELDALDNTGSDLSIQYKTTLSQLQDLDYTSALSNFSAQQTALEAAQKSFIKVAGLSLFNFIS